MCMKLPMERLHRCRKERGVAEDVEDILAGWHEDGLTLTDLDTVDIGLSPKTNHNDKRVAVEVNLLSYLYHHAMHHEVRTVDELRRGFGTVVRSTIGWPYLIVDGSLGLFYVELTGIPMHILSSEVIHTIGDITGLP